MPEFLKLLSPNMALINWLEKFPTAEFKNEVIPTEESYGRILDEDIYAPHSLPEFSRSTVDGFAVVAKDTFGSSEGMPAYLKIIGEVKMGVTTDLKLTHGTAVLIHTGGMLPEGADAVVMLENSQTSRQDEIEITKSVAHLENIIQVGEDVQTGELILNRGTLLRMVEIGGLMAYGILSVKVVRKPKVGIISTGDEVVPPSSFPSIGQVRDVNTYTLEALVNKRGGEAVRLGIVPDNPRILKDKLESALTECDAVLVTAGSSASAHDMTSQVINEAGKPGVIVHGINIRPGKPTILAVCNGKPVIGLPGNPVSALVIAWLFVSPMLQRLQGQSKEPIKKQISARLTINISSMAGREDYIPVKLTMENGEYQAEPIFFKSNLIFNLVKADGLMFIPADANGLNAGDVVQVFFL
ncbi:MAG: molybdopterin molybdenumtransferase MoeA [Leptolinea sp.]|jgi:molybdopterin molybdotransferase|nr:molybdopterin molybdenumtransferase MoeA [Leptolinea sp.]